MLCLHHTSNYEDNIQQLFCGDYEQGPPDAAKIKNYSGCFPEW